METQLNTTKSRHFRYSDELKLNLLSKLEQYINNTDMPYLQRFCLDYNVSDESIRLWGKKDQDKYQNNADSLINETWFGIIKKLYRKQELYLYNQALHNKVNVAMALFALKQPWHGWRDDYGQVAGAKDTLTISVSGEPANNLLDMLQGRLQANKTKNIDKKKSLRK